MRRSRGKEKSPRLPPAATSPGQPLAGRLRRACPRLRDTLLSSICGPQVTAGVDSQACWEPSCLQKPWIQPHNPVCTPSSPLKDRNEDQPKTNSHAISCPPSCGRRKAAILSTVIVSLPSVSNLLFEFTFNKCRFDATHCSTFKKKIYNRASIYS